MAATNQAGMFRESIELRWFFEGTPSKDVATKFHRFAKFQKVKVEAERRTDYYLKQNRATVGIKLRPLGAKRDIELKFLKESLSHEGASISGQVERWRKWSLPASSFKLRDETQVLKSEWLLIDKVREMATIPIPGKRKEPGEGCNMEITSLTFGSRIFWTLGFEAFSTSGRELSNFNYVLRLIDLGMFGVSLTNRNSFGYPHFLSHSLS